MKQMIPAAAAARASNAYKMSRDYNTSALWRDGFAARDIICRDAVKRALIRHGISPDVAYVYSRALYTSDYRRADYVSE